MVLAGRVKLPMMIVLVLEVLELVEVLVLVEVLELVEGVLRVLLVLVLSPVDNGNNDNSRVNTDKGSDSHKTPEDKGSDKGSEEDVGEVEGSGPHASNPGSSERGWQPLV